MRYVILRDDDTNALTPVDCLERLYRPFLERGLPVNLAAIPAVTTDARMADGRPEGFLLPTASPHDGSSSPVDGRPPVPPGRTLPMGANQQLVRYLLDNPGYHVVQHGYHHDFLEFDRLPTAEARRRLEAGSRLLQEAGFGPPQTFVAPYDRVSRDGLRAVADRFRVFSTGWFELRRLPWRWWPGYGLKKIRRAPHWRVRDTLLLSHPGCLLSCQRSYSAMLDNVRRQVEACRFTVLVTHWWEYFRNQVPDEKFISRLHETAEYLADGTDLRVITFDDLATGRVRLA